MITHIVFFKFKNRSDAKKAQESLLNMQGKIPQLRHLEVGVDIINSERSYDLALIAKVDSLGDLQTYQDHPVHQEVLKFLATIKESTVAVDFES